MIRKTQTANKRLVKRWVQYLNEALFFPSNSVMLDSLMLQNPLLRQAQNVTVIQKIFLTKNKE